MSRADANAQLETGAEARHVQKGLHMTAHALNLVIRWRASSLTGRYAHCESCPYEANVNMESRCGAQFRPYAGTIIVPSMLWTRDTL